MKAALERFKWVLWVVLGVAVGVVLLLIRSLFDDAQECQTRENSLPVPDSLRKKVEEAETAALVERVRAESKSDAERQELEQAMKLEGQERLKRLAEIARRLK